MTQISRRTPVSVLLVVLALVGSLIAEAPANAAGTWLRFAMSVSQPVIGVQTITPSAAYTGAMGSGGAVPAVDTALHGSGYPLKPSGVIDTPQDMWIEAGCEGTCVGNNYAVGVVAGNADRAQVDHVDFYLEGTKVTVPAPSLNPRTGTFAYVVNLASGSSAGGPGGGAGCNGDVKLTWDIVPVNGYVRRGSRHFTLNTQGAGNSACSVTAGLISHGGPYYVDNAGSDANTGLSSGSGAWATMAKAMASVPQGATVYVTSGQTFVEDVNNAASTYPTPSAPCRMIRFLPSTSGGTYTVTRSNRYIGYSAGVSAWRVNTCATEFTGLTADFGKMNTISDIVSNGSLVLNDFQVLDPSGPSGPDVFSANCLNMAASPCLYGPADGMATFALFSSSAKVAVINSARPSKMYGYTGVDLVVNWSGTQIALDTIANFPSPATGNTRDRAWMNAQVSTVTPAYQRGTTSLAQNLIVSGVNYCTKAISTPMGYTSGAASFIELTRQETTFTGSVSGTKLTVQGAVTNGPLLPGMIITGTGFTANITVGAYAGKDSSGNDTWFVTSGQSASSVAMTTTGSETFGNGQQRAGNAQYMVFGSGQGALLDKGMMINPYYGNATTDIVGASNDPACPSATLVRAGHPYLIADCGSGEGYRGTCDADYRNARTFVTDDTRTPVLAAPSSSASPVQVGQTALTFNLGHSDLGQFGFENSTNRPHENIVFQNDDFRSIESQPFLYQTSNYGQATLGGQSGTTWTADPISAASATFDSVKATTTISWNGSSVPGFASSKPVGAAVGLVGGRVSLGSWVVNVSAGCSSGCSFKGGTGSLTPTFTNTLVKGDRIAINGQQGVWSIDDVPDDSTILASSLTGLNTVAGTNSIVYKIGAAVHFTSGALAGQEFPMADNPAGQTVPANTSVVVGDASAAQSGDAAYINPGFQYGQSIHWVNCIGNAAANDTYSAVLAIPAGNQATMSRATSCGAGSTWYLGTGNVGLLYMGVNLSTNIPQETNFQALGQISGTVLGWAFIDSTLYGTAIYQRNAPATASAYNGYSVDYSAVFDSVLYNTPASNAQDAIIYDANSATLPQDRWNLDNNQFFGATAKTFGSLNSIGQTYDKLQFDLGMTFDKTFKPNFAGTTGLTLTKKGVQGNPNRPNGCPIYPVSAGVLMSCMAPGLVGARQP